MNGNSDKTMDKITVITPVKSQTRIQLTPTTREYLCMVCGENIDNNNYRLKLFHKDTKTSHCLLIEKHLNINVTQDDFTSHVCKTCIRKFVTVENKLSPLKEKYEATRRRLMVTHGRLSQKRSFPSADASSRKSLFRQANDENVNPLMPRQQETWAPTWAPVNELCEQMTLQQLKSPTNLASVMTEPQSTSALSQTLYGPGYTFNNNLVDLILTKDYERAGKEVLKDSNLRNHIVKEIITESKNDLKQLCKKDNLSILRGHQKDALEKFSLSNLSSELHRRLPLLWEILHECASNPNQEQNKQKKGESLLPQFLSSISKLIHLYNRDMNLFQLMNSLIMMYGGCKKSAFRRLNATGNCLSYPATLGMVDRMAADWEKPILDWKSKVELSISIEEDLERRVQDLDETLDVLSDTPDVTEILVLEQEQLKQTLKEHRETMHPGYYFIGDNVDLRTQVRQMTIKNQAKDYHMYNMCCYMNRVAGNNLNDTVARNDISRISFSEFIPGPDQHEKLLQDFSFLVAHEWCSRLHWLQPYKAVLPKYIEHPHMKEMCCKTQRVNMGVLLKNEQYNDQMVDICQFLHRYVPRHDSNEEESSQKPLKILSGGDYLTFERHKSAQASMANGRTPSSRLEGLIPKMEEFHNQAELLKVIWKQLYSTRSSKDIGTLQAARNTLNARNVTSEPSDNFYASSEFLDKFDAAIITTGGMHHFGMAQTDSEPTKHLYTGEIGNKKQMAEFLLDEAMKFLRQNLDFHVPQIPHYGPQNNTLMCRFCNKMYKKVKSLRKHESTSHGLEDPMYSARETTDPSTQKNESDGIQNYTQLCLFLGLLRRNHNDAIHMGDGQRILEVNTFLYLLYKHNNCPKYAYGILEFLAQAKSLLTERQSYRLIWNRTVNHRGKPNSNHPNDLDLEHQNKLFKDHIHSYRGVFTEKAIARVSRSAVNTEQIMKAYDTSLMLFRPSGVHTVANTDNDVAELVKQFQLKNLFDYSPGRQHSQFENISSNPFQCVDAEKLRDWISASLKKYSQEHCYS